MYQLKIKEALIRKLYFAAKREGKKMTHLINEILAEYLSGEPDPSPYEGRDRTPYNLERKMRAIQPRRREYPGGHHGDFPCAGRILNGSGERQRGGGAEVHPPHESVSAKYEDARDPSPVCRGDVQGGG
jgi:hypothetical protein